MRQSTGKETSKRDNQQEKTLKSERSTGKMTCNERVNRKEVRKQRILASEMVNRKED